MDSSSVTFVHCVEKCVDKPVEDMHTSPDNIELGELGDPDESFFIYDEDLWQEPRHNQRRQKLTYGVDHGGS